MKLHDGNELTPDQIEELNAHGPFSMAVWSSGEVCVGNEEGLAGRSEYFVKLMRNEILGVFSRTELSNMSILDIGCNDGWVLHQLSDIPFRKMVGIEPREKNIAKGKKVREVLKISNRVEYRIGDIESLSGEKFDIVICAGLLYHVESIPLALRQLRNSCAKLLLIESRCLSDSHMTQELMDEIEMRDLVYRFKEKQCGITVQKYESSYHDGSAKSSTIVNIPSVDSLVMHLSLLGFKSIEVLADPETYRASVWQDKRPLSGVCLSARIFTESEDSVMEERTWISDYETGLERAILPKDLVEALYQNVVLGNAQFQLTPEAKLVLNSVTSGGKVEESGAASIEGLSDNKFLIEILSNLHYSPRDKIVLEYGKFLSFEGRLHEAVGVLRGISSKLNADWRSVYRSFALLASIHLRLGVPDEAERYKKLCKTCNPKYIFPGEE